MLGNDQIETLAERLLCGVTKQCSRGAVPPDDFARAVCIDFCTAWSAMRCRSNPVSVAVSQKREYFKYQPETIGDFAQEGAKFGVQGPTTKLQKSAKGGHLWDC